MGLSGFRGKVYYVNDACPTIDCTQFTEPTGAEFCWYDEVTKFTVVDSVQKKEYGHDKSEGWQDVVAGTRRLAITVDAMLHGAPGLTNRSRLAAGQVLGLVLYPAGVGCGGDMSGYAMIDQVSYTYDNETGQPIAYTLTLSSKGPWTGLGAADLNWGGFECECGNSGDGSVSM